MFHAGETFRFQQHGIMNDCFISIRAILKQANEFPALAYVSISGNLPITLCVL